MRGNSETLPIDPIMIPTENPQTLSRKYVCERFCHCFRKGFIQRSRSKGVREWISRKRCTAEGKLFLKDMNRRRSVELLGLKINGSSLESAEPKKVARRGICGVDCSLPLSDECYSGRVFPKPFLFPSSAGFWVEGETAEL